VGGSSTPEIFASPHMYAQLLLPHTHTIPHRTQFTSFPTSGKLSGCEAQQNPNSNPTNQTHGLLTWTTRVMAPYSRLSRISRLGPLT